MFDLQFSSSMQDSLITMRRIVFASPECAGHVEGIFINLWGDRSFIIQVLGPSKLAGLSKSDRKTPGKYHGSFYNGKLKGNPFWLDQQKNWSSSRNWGFGKQKKHLPKIDYQERFIIQLKPKTVSNSRNSIRTAKVAVKRCWSPKSSLEQRHSLSHHPVACGMGMGR